MVISKKKIKYILKILILINLLLTQHYLVPVEYVN